MKLVSYTTAGCRERLGIVVNGLVHDISACAAAMNHTIPQTMLTFLDGGASAMDAVREVEMAIAGGHCAAALTPGSYSLLAPVPHPRSCRDGYAFRQHVATARRNRGVDMIPEFDQFPVFYFTNHQAIFGEGPIEVELDHLQQLDFELEAAVVIGREGKNISSERADEYIAGFTIMNDFSARALQMEEMKLSLGPAKGKDFATTLGPWLVTPEELRQYTRSTPSGVQHDLRMTAFHNNTLISDGNLGDMNWTFAELIERASYGVTLYPGDVIGSGTVGSGCYLELNGTRALEAKARGESFSPTWLNAGDTIALEITGLGRLSNSIVKSTSGLSLLAKRKHVAAVS